MIGFLGSSQTFVAQILFAIDVIILFGQVFDELLVDDCEGSFIAHVSLLYTNVESGLIDGTAEAEGHKPTVYPNTAAYKADALPAVESPRHRP